MKKSFGKTPNLRKKSHGSSSNLRNKAMGTPLKKVVGLPIWEIKLRWPIFKKKLWGTSNLTKKVMVTSPILEIKLWGHQIYEIKL